MGSRHGRQPYIRVHLESAEDVVIVEGFGDDVTTDPVLGGRIVAEWLRKYAKLAPEPVNDGVFRMRPRTARAWSRATLDDGTRYIFPTTTSNPLGSGKS